MLAANRKSTCTTSWLHSVAAATTTATPPYTALGCRAEYGLQQEAKRKAWAGASHQGKGTHTPTCFATAEARQQKLAAMAQVRKIVIIIWVLTAAASPP
jgi:uncharacterized protein YgiB involved in biofilm formation